MIKRTSARDIDAEVEKMPKNNARLYALGGKSLLEIQYMDGGSFGLRSVRCEGLFNSTTGRLNLFPWTVEICLRITSCLSSNVNFNHRLLLLVR
jgi:hypothetical protein